MSRLLNLKPLVLLILFNYVVIVFGSQVFYTIQINTERILRPLPRPLVGFIQTVIGSVLILLWIFVWIKLYKLLFLREISRDAEGTVNIVEKLVPENTINIVSRKKIRKL